MTVLSDKKVTETGLMYNTTEGEAPGNLATLPNLTKTILSELK